MSLICRLVERSIAASVAREAEPGPTWVRRHVDRCPECTRILADMRALSEGLTAALDAPEPSAAFVSRVWARVDAPTSVSARPTVTSALLWVGTLAAATALAGVGIRTLWPGGIGRVERPGSSVLMPAPSPPGAVVAERTDRTEPAQKASDAGAARQATDDQRRAAQRDRAAEKAAIRRMLRLRQRIADGKRPATGRNGAHAAAVEDAPAESPQQPPAIGWAELGYLYEAQSDAYSAAYAYRQAWRERRDAGTAFAAGRMSEAAGDILSAVEHYADLLDDDRDSRSANEGA